MDLDGDVDLFGDEVDFRICTPTTEPGVSRGAGGSGSDDGRTALLRSGGRRHRRDRLPEVFRSGDGFMVMSRNLGGLAFGDWEVIHDTPDFPRICHSGLAFGDLDLDGDLDISLPGLDLVPEAGALVTIDSSGWVPGLDTLFENVGEAWTVDRYLSPWGNEAPGFSLVQQFTDKDNDGDLDLMSGTDWPLGGTLPPLAFWTNVGGVAAGCPTSWMSPRSRAQTFLPARWASASTTSTRRVPRLLHVGRRPR